MKLNILKSTLLAAVASLFVMAPLSASAQHYGGDGFTFQRNRGGAFKNIVDRTERHSNSFRDYFEHNFRSNGHGEEWTWDTRSGHPAHEGRNGQMTLRDAIQNLDEDFERLRSEVDHHGRTRRAREIMDEILQFSNDVDTRIPRVRDWYNNTRDARWRWDRSDLSNRWRDLRTDISDLNRNLNGRGGF